MYRETLPRQRMYQLEELQRFSELVAAFTELSADREDIQLRGSAAPPPLGYAVRLQPHPRSAGIELMLWLGGARLCSWGANGDSSGTGHRAVHLDLKDGYQWECLMFPDAHSLAAALLHRMQREAACVWFE